VLRLHRGVYAGLTLEGLAPGEWRELTPEEVASLVRVVGRRDLHD
jgi:16S rRNA U516 pseudouridylate synthase RsuA-like enzyme